MCSPASLQLEHKDLFRGRVIYIVYRPWCSLWYMCHCSCNVIHKNFKLYIFYQISYIFFISWISKIRFIDEPMSCGVSALRCAYEANQTLRGLSRTDQIHPDFLMSKTNLTFLATSLDEEHSPRFRQTYIEMACVHS